MGLFEKEKEKKKQNRKKTKLWAYYGFQHKGLKSNNIHPKCQIAVMLFIISPNSFAAEAKVGECGLGLSSVFAACIQNVLGIHSSKGPGQYQRESGNEY